MARRLYPLIVTIVGGVGLGLALTYFVAVFLAFVPEWDDWSEFFVPRALYLLIPPYVLLIVHLVLRNHVGRYFLKSGDYDEAVGYARRRMNASVLRSRREAANQRLVAARGLVGLGEYDEARQLLEGKLDNLPGPYAMEARRWLMEIALRHDDRQAIQELRIDEPGEEKPARGELAAALACEAEWAVRQGDKKGYLDRLQEAMWQESDHPRAALSRGLAMMRFDDDSAAGDEVMQFLDRVDEAISVEIPARRAEMKALKAMVQSQQGNDERARKLLEEAGEGPMDPWTRRIVEKARKLVDDTHGSSTATKS